ncbi:hypothetical protein BKA59DRAFT_459955 [Fusarium tricinctum]|jgi:hypothetical protein|uniref:Uncharacterized protein n=1 Tax=Fusarium tricinctum TaxID=61284 RepID=A0A8K0RLM0_9HYPO|nr:hypothetical protein BKA59DRAFT_459955 [Fusarium tricinctum]
MACEPVYRGPEEMRRAALEALDRFERLGPHEWPEIPSLFLDENGSFECRVRDEQHPYVKLAKGDVDEFNCPLPSSPKLPFEVTRLSHARRGLLYSLLVHTYFWTRDNVLNEGGELVRMRDREVLSPDGIFALVDLVQKTNGCYDYERVRDVLEKIPLVSLPINTRWNDKRVVMALAHWEIEYEARRWNLY